MKKLLIAVALSVLALGAAHAAVLYTPPGPATVKLNSIISDLANQQVGAKTNHSNTATNITQMFKSTIAQSAFGNADLLALLANSFNTSFPDGSQIGMRYGSLFVVDRTGTNIIFTPNGVVSFQFDVSVAPMTETLVTTENSSGTQHSGNLNETIIASVTMSYDDTVNTTTDGTHTKFAFKGLFTTKLTENLKTLAIKATYTLDGTGGGPVRGVQTILTGTISGKASGVVPTF